MSLALAKISEKSRKIKHFSYILIYFKEIIESCVRKYKYSRIILLMSFLP